MNRSLTHPPSFRPHRGGSSLLAAAVLLAASCTPVPASQTWRGLVVQPENRCSAYSRKDYPYPQSVEARIVASMGGRIYGPYSGRTFAGIGETDIEHVVATSEAHDSGLCAADAATRRTFARDILNLTLASPAVNRGQKSDRDAAQWLPERNRCWFAGRVVQVRRKYGLTVDRREADALESVLSGCASVDMVFHEGDPEPAAASRKTGATQSTDAPTRWDDDGNGRITCAEARRHGIAPVASDHPAYRFMRDGDGDGVVCE